MQQQAPTFGRRGAAPPSAAVAVARPNPAQPRPAQPRPPVDRARAAPAPARQNFLVWLLTSFEGRVRRRDYWLAYIGITLAVMVAQGAVRAAFPHYPTALQMLRDPAIMFDDSTAYRVPALLMALISIPAIYLRSAVLAKRWHDRGKTGWLAILTYVPLVSLWPFIELGFFDGQPGENRFGPSPKNPGIDPDVFS
jgi:uncharacterized membrane protein YhaH (DUF805 family)